jgi:hypothetical protein
VEVQRGVRQGITPAQFDAALARQGGTCAICGRGSRGMAWCVDHDHELAARHGHESTRGCIMCFRGILCRTCNVALGNFMDSPALMRRAAAYVELGRGAAAGR